VNISGTDQAIDKQKTVLATTIFPTFDEHNSVNFGPLTKKMTLTFDLTLTFNKFLQVVKVHVHAKFHQAECSDSRVICPQTFLRYLAMVKNPKIRSCNLDLWSMTLKIRRVRAVVKVHVHAKFHRAKCSDSLVIVLTKKTRSKQAQACNTAPCLRISDIFT